MAYIRFKKTASFMLKYPRHIKTVAWLVVLYLFMPYLALSQDKPDLMVIDSLEKVLSGMGTGDDEMLPVLKKLAAENTKADAYKAIEYGNRALSIIKKNKLPDDADLFITLGRAYDRIPDFKTSNELYRKALSAAQEQKDLEGIINAYEMLGWHYYRRQEYGSSRLNFEMALETAEMVGKEEAMAWAYYGLGLIYSRMEDWKNQYEALRDFLSRADRSKDALRMADAWRMQGNYYRNEKEYNEAVICYDSTYALAASIGDSAMMGIAINHKAWAY